MKSCIEIEKQSGAFLFKAITSGAWAEMSKFVVAIKVPPILPNEREYTSLKGLLVQVAQIRLKINRTLPIPSRYLLELIYKKFPC
jgi:hypothetical protein